MIEHKACVFMAVFGILGCEIEFKVKGIEIAYIE